MIGVDKENPISGEIPGMVFVKGDLSDKNFVDELFQNNQQPNKIFHLAGQSSAEVSMHEPVKDLHDNFLTTRNILDKAQPQTHIIFASSMAVYGDANGMASETQIPRPVSNYGLHKRMSERILLSHKGKCHVTVLRFFNVYGPGQNLSRLNQGMISIYLAMALNGGPIQVKGALTRIRDFVYIDDVLEILVREPETNLRKQEIMNISSGKPNTVQEVLDIIQQNLGLNSEIRQLPQTRGDVSGFYGSILAREKALGVIETRDIHSGIQKFVDFELSKRFS